jgi:hypothetical protein
MNLPALKLPREPMSGFLGLMPNFVSVALFEPEQSSGVLNQTLE